MGLKHFNLPKGMLILSHFTGSSDLLTMKIVIGCGDTLPYTVV